LFQEDHGVVAILGRAPNTAGHGVPGHKVGYSPQEMALYTDLTVIETLQFYGRLHNMTSEEIQERIEWLLEFLELNSHGKKLIAKLSGGQQRRVSLAVALLHNPSVMILDEPTVGLDPLLRTRIWGHLKEISKSGVTVIITTHYIEEARQADCVGLMRKGRILAEGEPEELMLRYNQETLEDVFLELCRNGDYRREFSSRGSSRSISTSSILSSGSASRPISESVKINVLREDTALLGTQHKSHHRGHSAVKQGVAITRRKLKQYGRNPLMIIFDMIVPTIEILIYIFCVGTDPANLPVSSCHVFII